MRKKGDYFDLTRFREERGISQRELSKVLHCSQSFLSSIEHYKRSASPAILAKLKEIYHVEDLSAYLSPSMPIDRQIALSSKALAKKSQVPDKETPARKKVQEDSHELSAMSVLSELLHPDSKTKLLTEHSSKCDVGPEWGVVTVLANAVQTLLAQNQDLHQENRRLREAVAQSNRFTDVKDTIVKAANSLPEILPAMADCDKV